MRADNLRDAYAAVYLKWPLTSQRSALVPSCVFFPQFKGRIYQSTHGVNNMATFDWSQCPAVESVPGKVSGAWVFRDTRMPVKLVFENLEDAMNIEEIMEQYDVTREQITVVILPRAVWTSWLLAMLVLFDNNLPRALSRSLKHHVVIEARARGLGKTQERRSARCCRESSIRGDGDRTIRYQQNLTGRKIALVVLTQGQMGFGPAAARCHGLGSRCRNARILHRGGSADLLIPP